MKKNSSDDLINCTRNILSNDYNGEGFDYVYFENKKRNVNPSLSKTYEQDGVVYGCEDEIIVIFFFFD
jgi:hypothetical protein